MSRRRILILAPWPVHGFGHRGQLRAAAIVDAYRAYGHEVLCLGMYDPAAIPPHDIVASEDFALPPKFAAAISVDARDTALRYWRMLARDPASLAFYRGHVARFRPDLIEFEEPYLWPLAQAIRPDGVPIVHSSYNHESFAKNELRSSGVPITLRTLTDIASLEVEIARGADLVVTVSLQDAEAFRAKGASDIVVAPNGAHVHPRDEAAERALGAWLRDEPYALFVSSAHPPNAEGLVRMLRAASRTALPQGRLLVAGRVADLIRDRRDAEGGLFARVTLLGEVDPALLGALHHRAACIMLPKTHGGGSNLKTAEALLAQVPIVATTRAFEGFEQHMFDACVAIEDDPRRFWREVAACLAGPRLPCRRRNLDDLRWETCLEPMVTRVEALLSSRDRAAHPVMRELGTRG